jgi:hypothetical protein
MIQGEVRIWKRGTTHCPVELADWADVLDQALHNPHVDWLIRTETSPSETIRIRYTWVGIFSLFAWLSTDHQITRISFLLVLSSGQRLSPSNPTEPPLPAQVTLTPANSSAASSVVLSPARTRTDDILERQRQVVTYVPPLASVRFTQSRGQPDVAYDLHTGATSASVTCPSFY